MQTTDITLEKYTNLCIQVWKHNKSYYVDNSPTISDYDYDMLVKTIEYIEHHHPEWVTAQSPTQRVGSCMQNKFPTIKHSSPMLSLSNSYSYEDVKNFVEKIQGQHEEVSFVAEAKIDGIAISVIYKKGQFLQATTRGNGIEGEDVTNNVKTIENLPLMLVGDNIPDTIEIRGEIFMNVADFENINKERNEQGKSTWANPRNAAGGTLKLLNPQETSKRKLSATFYDIVNDDTFVVNQCDVKTTLNSWGLPSLSLSQRFQSIDDLLTFIENLGISRSSLPFCIDGVVIKVNEKYLQQNLGNTSKYPRWAIAYKFSPHYAITTIEDIAIQISRYGIATPVAMLKPIKLCGSIISRATLHNNQEIERKDFRIGDFVKVVRGGDVIPKVESVIESKRFPNAKRWEMPPHCPSCGFPLQRNENLSTYICKNHDKCKEQQIRKIAHFVSKDAMDIEYLGEKVIRKLFDNEIVTTIADIYKITPEKLATIEGFQKKSIANAMFTIERSKKVSLENFIFSIGIPYVGKMAAELLAKHILSIENAPNLDKKSLLNVDGIGEKTANSIIQFFAKEYDRIQELLNLGVSPTKYSKLESSLTGKTFVLTGTLRTMTRSEACQAIKDLGGKISSSITKSTEALIVGESPGSKLQKAKKLKIQIIEEEEFHNLIATKDAT